MALHSEMELYASDWGPLTLTPNPNLNPKEPTPNLNPKARLGPNLNPKARLAPNLNPKVI